MNYYFDVLKKYAVFEGRASRKEYWMFYLFNLLILVGLYILGRTLHPWIISHVFSVFYFIYSLAVFIPNIAVLVRRLHDTNHSGWWLLIGAIPLIGAIWLLILLIKNSDAGENRYGSNPKGVVIQQDTIIKSAGPVKSEKKSTTEKMFLCIAPILFIVSMFLPAIVYREGIQYGYQVLAIGWLAIFTLMFAWYANVIGLIAFIIVFTKQYKLGMFLAMGACIFGLQSFFFTTFPQSESYVDSWHVSYLGTGFYVWISSFFITFLYCFVKLQKSKNKGLLSG